MANVNDTNNTLGRLANQWEDLYEADIDDRDRDAIEEFCRHREGLDDMAPGTVVSDLSLLRNASDRADTPLIEMDMRDVRRLFRTLTAPKGRGGYGLDPKGEGMKGYKRALRVFFQWIDSERGYGDYPFWEDIKVPSSTRGRVDEEQLLEEEVVTKLKEAANHARDRALIEFLADTAARISLASQLRVGDIKGLETDRPEFTPNPDGINHKGAPDKRYPILYSQADLRSYLNNHHIDSRPEAPLWHVLRGYDTENPEMGALSGDRIRDVLRECRQRAGVDKPVNPHNFRHTAITRLRRSGARDDLIQHVAGGRTGGCSRSTITQPIGR